MYCKRLNYHPPSNKCPPPLQGQNNSAQLLANIHDTLSQEKTNKKKYNQKQEKKEKEIRKQETKGRENGRKM